MVGKIHRDICNKNANIFKLLQLQHDEIINSGVVERYIFGIYIKLYTFITPFATIQDNTSGWLGYCPLLLSV